MSFKINNQRFVLPLGDNTDALYNDDKITPDT